MVNFSWGSAEAGEGSPSTTGALHTEQIETGPTCTVPCDLLGCGRVLKGTMLQLLQEVPIPLTELLVEQLPCKRFSGESVGVGQRWKHWIPASVASASVGG